MELDVIQSRKWNIDWVIVFQMDILQHVQLVTGAKIRYVQIYAHIASCNRGSFYELVYKSYIAAMGYLGRSRGNQNMEHHLHTFSNRVLPGKLHESVRFVCKCETGGALKTNKLALKKGIMDEIVAYVLVGKHMHKIIPPILHWRCMTKRLFFCLESHSAVVIHVLLLQTLLE